MTRNHDTGIVAIGRNEGERLRRCLESAIPQVSQVVYVDSGSTDGSRELARSLGVAVVELDNETPFTAARARNAGFDVLAEGLVFVQFVDGDCELDPRWIARAREEMLANPNTAVACGRRAERHPSDSIYNRLCDMEWDTPIGEATECGGDSLIRTDRFRAVGGFCPDLIAGEEPELCSRLRAAGGRVVRVDAPMTLHDARMDSFSQWWTRSVRAGHANAEGAVCQAAEGGPRAGREVRSTWFWGAALPGLVALAGLAFGGAAALLLAALYPLQIARIARRHPRPRFSDAEQWLYAAACVLGKLPNAQGQLRYWLARLTGRRSELIEYKGPIAPGGEPS